MTIIDSPPRATAEPGRPSAHELAAAAADRYAGAGWVAAPGFFSPADVADIARWTDELATRPEVPGAHMLYRESSAIDPTGRLISRIENFCPFHAGFDRLIRGGRLQRAVEQLLDAPAVLFKEKINFKMPGGAGFEAHQDQQAGWTAYAPLFVTALVTIDPATVDNGCLEIAATMPRQTRLIGREWAPLTDDEMGGHAFVPIPTRPGDVLFFDSFVPHASKPNATGTARRILYLTFNRAVDGDHRARYYADKRANFPPDVERRPGVEYRFRV